MRKHGRSFSHGSSSLRLAFVAALSSCASRAVEGEPASPREPVSSSAKGISGESEPQPPAPPWRFEGAVLSGTACQEAELPTWVLDEAEHRVTLAGDSATVIGLPPAFSAELEQPRLLVLRGPAPQQGFRSTFELFIGPICETVDGPAILGRIAARAWAPTREPESTRRAVVEGRWPASLGGIGRSLILEVELDSADGPSQASLYFTEYGRAKTFAIYAAAACPGRVPPVESEGRCQSVYRAMLE